MSSKVRKTINEYIMLTFATILLVVGVYYFKFTNNFSFGGVTGAAIVLGRIFRFSASSYTFLINMALLILGFIFLGKSFGIKTVYVSVLMSVSLSVLEWVQPLSEPLTSQPLLELLFAVFLPGLSSAILFNMGASSGGTDILAMILKKYTTIPIGTALMIVDVAIVIASCFVFGVETGLFSLTGLLAKSLVIDTVIENINLCKAFNIVCDEPEPICDYICNVLNRSATVYHAEGAFTHHKKAIILTVMKRSQAVQLRNFVHQKEPGAFILISNSSEIIGKGFRGLN